MRSLIVFTVLLASAEAQQAPFIPISGPNAPNADASLFEDSRGGLWLAKQEGPSELRYFDGTRFINPVVGSFPQGQVNQLAEDSNGGIWIPSERGLYRLFRGRLEKLVDGWVRMIVAIAPDVFLISVTTGQENDANLVRVKRQNGVWTMASVARIGFVALEPDRLGNLLYPCAGGFCEMLTAEVERWRPGVILRVTRHKASIGSVINRVHRDRFGCIWIRGVVQAAYQCPSDPAPHILPAAIAGAGSSGVGEMRDGSIVISSFNRLSIGRPGKFRVLTVANGLPGAGSHLVARDDTIWLSGSNGLFALVPKFLAEFWGERDGLSGNTWSVLPARKKLLAIAGDSVRVLDRDRSRWLKLLEFSGAMHLLETSHHELLVGSQSGGVIEIDNHGRILRRSVAANAMMLAQTPEGQVWATGDGIRRVIPEGKRLQLRREDVSNEPKAGIEADLKVGTGGELWTCFGQGLLFRNLNGWHRVLTQNPPYFNWALTIDRSGSVWYERFMGLSVITNPMGKSPEGKDFYDEARHTLHFLGTDHVGRLWRGTSNGVYVADPEEARQNQWLHLDRTDGLPGKDTNQRSFTNDIDGSVWFGIDNSVIHIFPPADLVHPTYAPSVFVSGFTSENGQFQMADLVESVPSNTNLTAHLGSLQMDRRNSLNFRYRLLPQQTSWMNGTATDINLGTPGWGDHNLEVQARLLTGPWSSTVSKNFHVLRPAWLSTPWLIAFALFAGAAAAGGREWRRLQKHRADTILPELAAWRLAVVSPDLNSLEGALFDNRFEVLRIVARGGFATVWEGHDRQQSNRLCAIKVFRHELLDKSWMQKRFQHEVSALTQIHHPNVVRIYGHGTVPSGSPYLAMEFIHGLTLRDKLSNDRLTVVQTASYLRQAASALAEIHAHGVCHRDVKPENLMIRTNGKDLVLIDFSIAIVQDPDETIHGLSRAAGTMHYMAPEQAVGYANESSDIYSLAKILIEMLTGQRLSTLLPDASIDLPDRVRELELGLSPESTDLLAKALEFDPSRRPKEASAFGEMLATDLEKT